MVQLSLIPNVPVLQHFSEWPSSVSLPLNGKKPQHTTPTLLTGGATQNHGSC